MLAMIFITFSELSGDETSILETSIVVEKIIYADIYSIVFEEEFQNYFQTQEIILGKHIQACRQKGPLTFLYGFTAVFNQAVTV